MTLQYLMDENVNPVYVNQLRRRYLDLVVWAIGEPNTPLKGTLDPEILLWCEVNNFILVTNNRTSMPVHLADYLNQNHHIPGIFILNPAMSIGETIEELIVLAECSLEAEYQDQIIHLPIS
jgi:predicted nuclease of predicted toxin-antitoxin system